MEETEDRRTQILGAAFAEFAAKGFNGATIKSIAQAAQLRSPALIYWYFPNKESLFQEAFSMHAPILQAIAAPEVMMERPPAEILPLLAKAFVETASDPVAQHLFRMVIGEGSHREALSATFIANGPLRVLEVLSSYLTRQIEQGRLRPHNTASSARAFIGMLIPQALGNGLLPPLAGEVTNDAHITTAVDIFLRGLLPST